MTLDYATKAQVPKRRSRLAVASFIVSLLASPLTVLWILNHERRQIDRNHYESLSAASLGTLCATLMAIAFGFPVLALIRVYLSRTLRGAAWGWMALIVSILGWGLAALIASALSGVGGAS